MPLASFDAYPGPPAAKRKRFRKRGNVTALRKHSARSRVTNGAIILAGLVDHRCKIARRYTDIIACVISDMGGLDNMSEARMQLARRFSALAVQAEQMEAKLANGEPIDIAEYTRLTSTLVRVVTRLGIKRRAKTITTPSVRDYLEHVQQGDNVQGEGDE